MAETNVIKPSASGVYALSTLAMDDVTKVDIVDVDLVLRTKDGQQFILPGAGLSAMGEKPNEVAFQDVSVSTVILLGRVNSTLNTIDRSTILTSAEPETLSSPTTTTDETTKEQIKEAVEKAVKEAVKEAKTEAEKERHKQDSESSSQSQTASLTTNTESSVEQLVEKAQKIIDNLHTSDYKFNPPHEYTPPPSAAASPPGVPPPISLTPVTTLFMGNVVGTTYDTVTSPGTTIIYGGGGAVGSDSTAQIGPRNALQFSAATIAGTAGNDLIYAEGPALGNTNPAVSTSLYAKEFILNVAGYFITLNDIQFSGVPAGVTIVGATDNGGGSWTLAADFVIKQNTFTIIYDSASTGSFDMVVDVTGKTTRAQEFQSQQNFRFQYLNVTDASQVTDQTLVYENKGRLQEIYILPTQDQPNIISLSTGTDTVQAGRNDDTITGGDGDKTIYAREGNDTVTIGNGNNLVDLGSGTNSATTGSGDDIITAADGNNTIIAGDGINQVTLGDGTNSVTTGSGGDTIIVGDGNSTISAGGGINSITGGIGFFTITSGSNDDTIILTSGGGNINAGDGVNNIQAGAGNYTITTGAGGDIIVVGAGNSTISAGDGNNSVTVGAGTNSITTGSGNDTLIGSTGSDTFRPGLGSNAITGGGGTDMLDYSDISSTGISVSLLTGTATGTGLNDTFSGITNLIATSNNDTIFGSSASQTITAGAGNDSVSGNGGNDIIYGGDGNDTLTGGTGIDTIYGGTGNNVISGGTSGADFLYGGTGNDTFNSPHAGVYYSGTDAATLATGEVNLINYAADTAGMNINLLTGIGSGGLAEGSRYALTSVSGYGSINSITGGNGSDTITGSNSDDTISGGSGSDYLTGGAGTNILIGGGGGTDQYVAGTGSDTFTASNTSYDLIYYRNSGAGVVVNLSSTTQSFVNSLGVTRTVAAYSGGNFGVTAADANSFSVGDTYTVFSGTSTSIDRVDGSNNTDLIFAGSDYLTYYNTYGGNDTAYAGTGGMSYLGYEQNDSFFGSSGNDTYYFSNGRDVADGGTGFDIIRTNSYYNSDFSVVLYLDGSADTNTNGIADYLDRSVGSLTRSGNTFTGFEYGWGNATTGAVSTLIKNFDNIVGNTANEYFVGNNNANQINARGGINTVFGMGGDDTITVIEGFNSIDGGSGTDTVNFQYQNNSVSGSLAQESPNSTYGVQVFLADGAFLGASDKASYWGAGFSIYQSRTGATGAYSYSTITAAENINGSDYSDVLYGNGSANTLYGNNSNDVLAGGGGADSLFGGAGNDTFRVTASDAANVVVFNGSTGSDTLYSPGFTFSAGSINTNKYISIDTVDVRNSLGTETYGLSAADIQALVDNGNSSTLSLKLDSGDVFNPTGFTSTSGSGSDITYRYYQEAGLINQIAMLNVHYGAG